MLKERWGVDTNWSRTIDENYSEFSIDIQRAIMGEMDSPIYIEGEIWDVWQDNNKIYIKLDHDLDFNIYFVLAIEEEHLDLIRDSPFGYFAFAMAVMDVKKPGIALPSEPPNEPRKDDEMHFGYTNEVYIDYDDVLIATGVCLEIMLID